MKTANKQIKYQPIVKSGNNFIKDVDSLKHGNCVCVIRNNSNGAIRYAKGSVVPFPYSQSATPEIKKKYGKNLVYVISHYDEDVVGYYQKPKLVVRKKVGSKRVNRVNRIYRKSIKK